MREHQSGEILGRDAIDRSQLHDHITRRIAGCLILRELTGRLHPRQRGSIAQGQGSPFAQLPQLHPEVLAPQDTARRFARVTLRPAAGLDPIGLIGFRIFHNRALYRFILFSDHWFHLHFLGRLLVLGQILSARRGDLGGAST